MIGFIKLQKPLGLDLNFLICHAFAFAIDKRKPEEVNGFVMKPHLRWLIWFCFLIGAISRSTQAEPSVSNGPFVLTGHRLAELMASVEEWSSDANYSQDGWSKLIRAAKIIQTNTPESVEKALFDYQMNDSRHGDFENMTVHALGNDGKLFLLMRVVFELPERAATEPTRFGEWIGNERAKNRNGTFNLAWPLRWHDGHPVLTYGCIGIQGYKVRYKAREEYRYFRDTFPKRNLDLKI
jgi:hypothetical protein